MARNVYRKVIALIRDAARLARAAGIPNLLQPGLVKEMIVADILGHELIVGKRDADARSPDDPSVVYEYLSCKEGGAGQLDRMFKAPAGKRKASMHRILRNDKIYLAVFYKEDQTRVKIIYELAPDVAAKEARRQLKRSINDISHISFSETWARQNGTVVHEHRNHRNHRNRRV